MIEEPTVFVLGAGAGFAYDLPLGEDLNRQIIDHIRSGGVEKDSAVAHLGADVVRRANTLADFLKESRVSIDDFLASNEDYLELGKFLITRIIARAEDPEKLRARAEDPEKLKAGRAGDWLGALWNLLRTPRPDALSSNRVYFITFNYDRSLEAGLMGMATSLYLRHSREELLQFLEPKIVHVHGKLGKLPWERGQLPERSYQPCNDAQVAFACSRHIVTVSEVHRQTEGYALAQEWLSRARHIHFLGFGYHAANLRRLRPETWSTGVSVAGTWHELPPARKSELEGAVGQQELGRPIRLHDSYEYMQAYIRNIRRSGAVFFEETVRAS